MMFFIFLAILFAAFLMCRFTMRKEHEKSLQRFVQFCDNFNIKLKLFAASAVVHVLADKYGEAHLSQRINVFKSEARLCSLSREETLLKVIQKTETETDPEKKNLFMALFYSTTTRWAKDLGMTEDAVRNHLNNFADQLGFTKEAILNTERN